MEQRRRLGFTHASVPPNGGKKEGATVACPRRSRRVKPWGFTLIEILLAVTIFSVIAVALYASFQSGIRVWRRAEENMELNHSIRLALDGFGRELRNAVDFSEESASAAAQQPEGQGAEEEKTATRPEIVFKGSKNELTFVTLIARTVGESKFQPELAKIRYAINADGQLLRFFAFQSDGFSENEDSEEMLLENIDELSFEYSYEADEKELPPVWKDYWEEPQGIPLGVKMHLKFKKTTSSLKDISKTVYISTGVLGKEEGFYQSQNE